MRVSRPAVRRALYLRGRNAWKDVTLSDLEIVAFLDESRKPVRDVVTGKVGGDEAYVVVAAVVLRGAGGALQSALELASSEVGAALHYGDLSITQQRRALQMIADIDEWDAYIFETVRPQRHLQNDRGIRQKAVEGALAVLGAELGVRHFTLETRATPARGFDRLDQDDNRTLQSAIGRGLVHPDIRIQHATKAEPLLHLPDLVVGARSDFLTNKNREPYPFVAHRVTRITQF